MVLRIIRREWQISHPLKLPRTSHMAWETQCHKRGSTPPRALHPSASVAVRRRRIFWLIASEDEWKFELFCFCFIALRTRALTRRAHILPASHKGLKHQAIRLGPWRTRTWISAKCRFKKCSISKLLFFRKLLLQPHSSCICNKKW